MLRRGDPGYEAARRDCVWNARIADRFPDVIVQAADAEDVVRAVQLAAEQDMRIGVRSGGHSWSGSHLRDGGMLLDLSRLTEVSIDAEARTAAVQPGVRGSDLAGALRAHNLFFPVGHCQGVALGGYLLQGGFGWLSRIFGPACASVTAIDVVTADGELLHADEHTNADLLWAARGAGPGFFAVVTRFHLQLHSWPATAMNSVYLYPVELLDEIYGWAHAIGPSVARSVEMMLFLQRPGDGQRLIGVTGPVLAASDEEARDALAILETCPVRDHATAASPYMPADFADLVATSRLLFPDGNRFAADNMWTSAPVAELLPGLQRIADTLPPEPSHAMWMNWGPPGAARHGLFDRGRHLHRAVCVLGRCRRRRALRELAGRPHARDGASRDRHPARRREPRRAPGALHHGRAHGAPGRDPCALRPRPPLPLLDDKRIAAETHTLSKPSSTTGSTLSTGERHHGRRRG